MRRWNILIHHIPPRPLYLRAKVRQRLAQVGAVALKSSVYALPQNADAWEDLEWIAQEIVAGGGEAHVLEAVFVAADAGEALVAQFRAERDADYERLSSDLRTAAKSARGVTASADLAAQHVKFTRRLEEIRRIDFFKAPKRAVAEEALGAIDRRAKRNRKQEGERMLKQNSKLKGKTWVTRPGIKVDRMASAWFIRRFIDPKARFRFDAPSAPRQGGDIRFDMVGADFTHEEDRCTLETLIKRAGLPDRAVKAIAEIVHDIDLKDAKFSRDEAPGVRRMLEGVIARCDSDADRLERGFAIFDDLHEALLVRPRKSAK